MPTAQAALQVFDGPAQVLLYHLINDGAHAMSEDAASKQPGEGQGQHSCMHISVLHTECTTTHLCCSNAPAASFMEPSSRSVPAAACPLCLHLEQNLFCQNCMCLSISYCNRSVILETACLSALGCYIVISSHCGEHVKPRCVTQESIDAQPTRPSMSAQTKPSEVYKQPDVVLQASVRQMKLILMP